MKKILLALILALTLLSCEDKGVTRQTLTGDESTLPAELKGLKVYRVSCGDGDYVKVAVINHQAISTTYKSGKHQQSVALVNKEVEFGAGQITERTINVESIISENDSIIVIKKSK
jgi:transcriptional antiterminator Rof (Rho-off)